MILGGALCLLLIPALIHEGYRLFAYGVIRPLPGLPSSYLLYCRLTSDITCHAIPRTGLSWSAHPVLFVVNLAVLLPSTIVFMGLVALVLWGWRTEQRNLTRRYSSPPLDNAIREPMDR